MVLDRVFCIHESGDLLGPDDLLEYGTVAGWVVFRALGCSRQGPVAVFPAIGAECRSLTVREFHRVAWASAVVTDFSAQDVRCREDPSHPILGGSVERHHVGNFTRVADCLEQEPFVVIGVAADGESAGLDDLDSAGDEKSPAGFLLDHFFPG